MKNLLIVILLIACFFDDDCAAKNNPTNEAPVFEISSRGEIQDLSEDVIAYAYLNSNLTVKEAVTEFLDRFNFELALNPNRSLLALVAQTAINWDEANLHYPIPISDTDHLRKVSAVGRSECDRSCYAQINYEFNNR